MNAATLITSLTLPEGLYCFSNHRIFIEVARVKELCHFTPFRKKGFKDVNRPFERRRLANNQAIEFAFGSRSRFVLYVRGSGWLRTRR
jgi:hypothetical protein